MTSAACSAIETILYEARSRGSEACGAASFAHSRAHSMTAPRRRTVSESGSFEAAFKFQAACSDSDSEADSVLVERRAANGGVFESESCTAACGPVHECGPGGPGGSP